MAGQAPGRAGLSRSGRLLLQALAGGALAAGPLAAAGGAPAPTIAATTDGSVRGAVEAGVVSWKGIPFAAPPVGPLRWRAPQPPRRWAGVRDATAYGHDCMQLPFPSDAAPLGTPPAEDCLYLNLWRRTGPARKLPVIVWIYGGGFVNGGSSPPTYSGANLAGRGVVFVSFNYRLGRFGTFAHPALTRANSEAKIDGGLLADYGYMDQLAALRWVQRNIAAFGGDPANVTIVGESAGGASVNTLVTSPLGDALFAKAVVMSGGDGEPLMGGAATLAAAEAAGLAFAEAKGIAADDPQAVQKLRALPAAAVVDGLNLAAIFRRDANPTYVMPVNDGRLAVPQAAAYHTGRFRRAPLMIGATSADIGGREGAMIAGARKLAGTIAEQGVPVWEYRFSYVAQSIGHPGAQHASDIPFFFDNAAIKYGAKTTPRDEQIGHAIAAYLVNFARTGDPNGPGLPAWPRYRRAEDRLMDFAESGEAVAVKDPWGE